MNDSNSMFGGWAVAIFVVVVLWLLIGGGCGFGNFGRNWGGCGGASPCEVEKQNIITAAETNYRVIDENRRSTDMISAQLRAQWDANQGEKIFDLKMNNLAQQNAYNLALSEKNATIERMTLANSLNQRFDALQAQISELSCNVPKRPPYFAQGYVACGQTIPNGCCC